MLEVICSGCGAKYKAPEKFAGRRMSCKACSGVILIGEGTGAPASSPAAEEEAPQASVAREEKAPGKKKISFKKGGIAARKSGKNHSFKKGGISKDAAASKTVESGVDGSREKSGGKKSPAALVLALLLVVGGLAALDYFVLNMVIGGGESPAAAPEVSVADDSPVDESSDEPQAPDEAEPAEPESPAGSEEPEEPAEEPAEDPPALAEIPAAAAPSASLIPVDAKFILGVRVPRLIGAIEGFTGEKLPRTPEALAAASLGTEPPSEEELEAVKKLMAAGLDPFNSIRRILIAVEAPGDLPGKLTLGGAPDDPGGALPVVPEADGLVIIEGKFDDPAAIISSMVEAGFLSPSDPEVKDGLNVYSVAGEYADNAVFTFLSKTQLLLTSPAWLEKVIALRKGVGHAIASKEVFNSLSKGLARKEVLWLVAAVPEEYGAALREGLSVPPGGIPGPDDEAPPPTPAIKIDTVMLALDSGGADFSLELIGVSPTPEDAENTKKTIGTQLGGMSILAMQMLGPKAIGLMGKLMPKSEGRNVTIAFTLNEQELATVKEMAQKAFSGFAGPQGDPAKGLPEGFELPEGFDPSEFEKPGEAVEIDSEPGSGPAVTILISGAGGAALKKKLSSAGEPGESVFLKLRDLVLADAQKADSGVDSISGSLEEDVATFEVGPVTDLEAFVGKLTLGKAVKVDYVKRTIQLDLLGGGEEPEAPTDPEPPADPKKKDAGEEEDPLELDDF